MDWQMRDRAARRRLMLLVPSPTIASPMSFIAGAPANSRWTSNHPRETYSNLDLGGIPFHCFPVTTETRDEQETAIWDVVGQTGTDLVVLARYMQILTDEMSAKLSGRLHQHPSFAFARLHQAHARGVKLIGAAANCVTSDLDEGRFIDQDVERISHRDTPDDLVRKRRTSSAGCCRARSGII
jgi:formyltetrahydrofolate deformylase